MSKRIKNNDTVEHTWAGMTVQPNEYYEIQANELINWANDSQLLIDISNGIAIVNNSDIEILVVNDAINFLKDNTPKEVNINNAPQVNPLPPVSIHCMEPWGCVGDSFEPRGSVKYVCNITLSDPSVDELTFTYNSDIELVPSV
jgi:hypothetical protein